MSEAKPACPECTRLMELLGNAKAEIKRLEEEVLILAGLIKDEDDIVPGEEI